MGELPFILGNYQFHQRLCLVTEVLAQFQANKPRPLSIGQVCNHFNCSQQHLMWLCRKLEESGFLVRDAARPSAWRVTSQQGDTSLWDIYEYVVAEFGNASSTEMQPDHDDSWAQRSAFIWMHCAVTVNQRIVQHLQQFKLEQIVKGGPVGSTGVVRSGTALQRERRIAI